MTEENKIPMTATECFEKIKAAKHCSDEKFLNELERSTRDMLDKAFAIGQNYKILQLNFTLNVIAKEHRLVKMGIDTYVYRDDIEQFINMYKEKNSQTYINIIELENFEREIPDEIAETVYKLKQESVFDEFLIAYTDYTDKTKKRVEKERDPIIFGVFVSPTKEPYDKFYYIGDWEDEYCDLTLEKMADTMAREKNKEIRQKTFSTVDPKKIANYIGKLEKAKGERDIFVVSNNKKPTIFKKVKNVLEKWIGV